MYDDFSKEEMEMLYSVRFEIHPKSNQEQLLFSLSVVGHTGERMTWPKPLKITDIQSLAKLTDPLLQMTGRVIIANNKWRKTLWASFILPEYLEQISKTVREYNEKKKAN